MDFQCYVGNLRRVVNLQGQFDVDNFLYACSNCSKVLAKNLRKSNTFLGETVHWSIIYLHPIHILASGGNVPSIFTRHCYGNIYIHKYHFSILNLESPALFRYFEVIVNHNDIISRMQNICIRMEIVGSLLRKFNNL